MITSRLRIVIVRSCIFINITFLSPFVYIIILFNKHPKNNNIIYDEQKQTDEHGKYYYYYCIFFLYKINII